MARSNLTDYLQVYPFWLMDVAPVEPLALPIFTPLFGFRDITAPEITLETTDISEANWFFGKKVAKHADASPLTLSRGVTFADSDFWRWMIATVTGNTGGASVLGSPFNAGAIGGPSPRRTLILIHFFSRMPMNVSQAAAAGIVSGLQFAAGAAGGGQALAGAGQNAALTFGSLAFSVGPFEFAARIPAKVYVLYNCIPTRYKVGSDFDATSGEISVGEVEVAYDYFEEIALAA